MRFAEHRRGWLVLFGFTAAIGLLQSIYKYLDVLARGMPGHYLHRLIEEMTGAYGVLVLLPALAWWARRARERAAGWPGRVAYLAPALPLFCILHTTWMFATRRALFPLLGLGEYDYGILSLRYPMEAGAQTIVFTMLVAFVYLLDHYREGQERAARLATTEKELTAARLASLRAQLHPHFLFNALNTVSSVMYEDTAAADRMLAGLGELLRHTLDATDRSETSLGDEVALLERYLDIMRTRFADRLSIVVEVPEELRGAAVPHLALQPLVENALRHGAPLDDRPGQVTIAAWRADGRLRLEVRDNGPGLRVTPARALSSGIGLSNTASRLATLYGADQRLVLDRAPEGGCLVALEMPYRVLAAAR